MPSNYLHLVTFVQEIATFAFFSSVVCGFVLILLTIFGVRKICANYKRLMVIFSGLGITLAGLEAIFHPNFHFHNNGFSYFSLSFPFGWSKDSLTMVLSLYAGVWSLTVSLLAVQLIYRYWSLFRPHRMTYFRGWKSLIWVAYCLVFGSALSLAVQICMKLDSTSADYFRNEILISYNVSISEIPITISLPVDPQTGAFRWWNVSHTIILSIIMTVQYGTMMYCGWNIHFGMEKKIECFSLGVKHIHRQLFTTLVFQITAPTILLFTPLALIIYLPYFQVHLSFPAGAAITAFSIYPAMDSMIVFLVVSEYRFAVRRFWKLLVHKMSAASTSSIPRGSRVETSGTNVRMSTVNFVNQRNLNVPQIVCVES